MRGPPTIRAALDSLPLLAWIMLGYAQQVKPERQPQPGVLHRTLVMLFRFS